MERMIMNTVVCWCKEESAKPNKSKEYKAALENLVVAIRNVLKFW